LIEPGPYDTDWAKSSAVHAEPMQAYARLHEARRVGLQRGDPAATASAILQIVDAADPPLRFFLGGGPLAVTREAYEKRLATWTQWEALSRAAQESRIH
jgi:hypothetical protein